MIINEIALVLKFCSRLNFAAKPYSQIYTSESLWCAMLFIPKAS